MGWHFFEETHGYEGRCPSNLKKHVKKILIYKKKLLVSLGYVTSKVTMGFLEIVSQFGPAV